MPCALWSSTSTVAYSSTMTTHYSTHQPIYITQWTSTQLIRMKTNWCPWNMAQSLHQGPSIRSCIHCCSYFSSSMVRLLMFMAFMRWYPFQCSASTLCTSMDLDHSWWRCKCQIIKMATMMLFSSQQSCLKTRERLIQIMSSTGIRSTLLVKKFELTALATMANDLTLGQRSVATKRKI